MAASGNISPEEKLLRLIRAPKKNSPLSAGETAKAALPQGARARSGFKFSAPWGKGVFLANRDKIILGLFISSCLYLAGVFIYPFIFLKGIKLPKVEAVPPQGSSEEALRQNAESLQQYLEAAGGKKIFGAAPGTAAGEPRSGAEVQSVKDINVVGIISGVKPQAIIEDKKNQKTYYVNKGQYVGEFLVEDIQEGKIIINARGQRLELYL